MHSFPEQPDWSHERVEAEGLCEKGNRLLDDGEPEEAMACFERAADLAPTLAEARMGLAGACMELERPGEAVDHLRRARDLDPGNPELPLMLAEAYMQADKPTMAVAVLRSFVRSDSAPTQARALLGKALTDAGALEDAEEVLEQALERDPASLEAGIAMARLRYLAGHPETAVEQLEETLRTHPESTTTRMYLAIALEDLGKRDRAIDLLRKAAQIDPDAVAIAFHLARMHRAAGDAPMAHEWARRALVLAGNRPPLAIEAASALVDLDRHEDARDLLQGALDDHPDDTSLLFHLGLLAQHMGDDRSAIALYQQVLDQEETHPGALVNIGGLYRKGARLEEAREVAALMVRAHPEEGVGWLLAGQVAEETGLLREAARAFEKAAEYLPGRAEPRTRLAGLHLRAGDKVIAQALLEEVQEDHPDEPGVSFYLGHLHELQGRKKAALACFERAAELDPEEMAYQRAAGGVLSSLGRHDEAIARFEAVIREDPADGEVLATIGQIHLQQGRHGEALPLFRRALDVEPGNPRHMLGLGRCLEGLGDWRAALGLFGEVLRENRSSSEAAEAYGRVALSHWWRPGVAIDPLLAAIAGAPENAVARFHACQLAIARGHAGFAWRQVAALDQLDPELARQARLHLGVVGLYLLAIVSAFGAVLLALFGGGHGI